MFARCATIHIQTCKRRPETHRKSETFRQIRNLYALSVCYNTPLAATVATFYLFSYAAPVMVVVVGIDVHTANSRWIFCIT